MTYNVGDLNAKIPAEAICRWRPYSEACTVWQFSVVLEASREILLRCTAISVCTFIGKICALDVAAFAAKMEWSNNFVHIFQLQSRYIRTLSHPLGHLRVTYALHLWLVGKPAIDFIFVVTELFFRYLLRLRRYERKSVEVGVFRRGWVTVIADFRGKGASPINHCWCQSSRVIALSCGVKISAVRHRTRRKYA